MTPVAEPPARERLRVTYVGHATLLLHFAGVCVLTDPNFDDRLGYFLPRVTPPGVRMAELPRVDAILLTHAHADHLSFRTLRALPAGIVIYAPPVISQWLRHAGIAAARPLLAGESVQIGALTITSARAKHVGARYGIDRWRGDSHMYLLDDGTSSVLFSGDTAITSAAADLALRITPRRVDIALLPIGDAPWWKRYLFRRGHLTPEDALTLFEQVDATLFIPFHWGTFRHVTSGAYDAINVLRALLPRYSRRTDVRILAPGETLCLTVDDR